MIGRIGKTSRKLKIFSLFITLLHIAGFLTSIEAIMGSRTPQGTIAWAISLNTFPALSLPAYWIFGRNKFNGYTRAFQSEEADLHYQVQKVKSEVLAFRPKETNQYPELMAGEKLANIPMLNGNKVELLIDGEQTFDSIFEGIDQAKEYVLVQFFIVKDDTLGRKLQKLLIKKAREGIRVFFLYDEIGSYGLGQDYLEEMRAAGVEAVNFHSRKGPKNRFQINFRNHRKIVVVDGQVCWVGGHNVGDEYLGKGAKFSHWRDTHLKITGPSTLPVQLSFFEDYHWATDSLLELDWQTALHESGDTPVLVIPSGPADKLETAGLMFHHAINSAKERIWIASPYFVPDNAIVSALELASLRGVDVRILIPDEADHYIVYLAAFSYINKFRHFSNIHFYRYTKGFMHQKAMLVDGRTAAIGTANFDNRSFRLNFELTAVVLGEAFNSEVEQMLKADFDNSRLMQFEEFDEKPFWFKFLVRVARLTSPML